MKQTSVELKNPNTFVEHRSKLTGADLNMGDWFRVVDAGAVYIFNGWANSMGSVGPQRNCTNILNGQSQYIIATDHVVLIKKVGVRIEEETRYK